MHKQTRAEPVAATTKTTRRKRRPPEEIMSRLLEAATEEFEKSGFGGATTAAIARRADVTEAQLFRYFDSKADIFQAAIFKPLSRHLAEFNNQYMADTDRADSIRDKARLYITELQNFIADHSKLFMSLIVAETYAPESTRGVSQIEGLETYFERGAAAMSRRIEGDATVDPALMVRVSFAAVLAGVLFKDWIFPPGLAADDDISAAIIDFVIYGISANEDPGLGDTH